VDKNPPQAGRAYTNLEITIAIDKYGEVGQLGVFWL